MELTIPFSTILMACLSFLGVYILMPVALILRDCVILKVVEKWVLSNYFWKMLDKNSEAKAYNNFFLANKTLDEGCFSRTEGFCNKINGRVITDYELKQFKQIQLKYTPILSSTTPFIQRRVNYVVWIDQHFKTQADFEGQVNKRAETVYSRTIEKIKAEDARVVDAGIKD